MEFLGNFLGGQQGQQDYGDFVNRYQQGHPAEGYDDDEVMNRYQQVSSNLPPEMYQQSAQEALARMSPDERAQFAQQMRQHFSQNGMPMGSFETQDYERDQDPNFLAGIMGNAHQQNPNLLAGLLGGGGGLGGLMGGGAGGALGGLMGGGGGGNPLAKAALAGVAAMAAKRFLG